MNERELRELELAVKRCQRHALDKVFNRLMDRVYLIDKVLFNEVGERIRYDAQGEKFFKLSEKWRELLTVERTYCTAAHEVVKIQKEFY